MTIVSSSKKSSSIRAKEKKGEISSSPDSPDPSESSSLSSSDYSSTISSHLSGDEQMVIHHIPDLIQSNEEAKS